MISRRKTRNASETNARFIANRRPQENKSVCTVKDTDRGRRRIRLLPFFMPQATRKRRTNTAQSSADFCSRQKSAENRFRPNNKRFFQPSKKCDFLNENSVKKSQMTAVCALGYKQAAALRAAVYGHTPQQTNRTKNNGKSERGGRGVRADPLANRPAHTAAQLSDFYAVSFSRSMFLFTAFRLYPLPL